MQDRQAVGTQSRAILGDSSEPHAIAFSTERTHPKSMRRRVSELILIVVRIEERKSNLG